MILQSMGRGWAENAPPGPPGMGMGMGFHPLVERWERLGKGVLELGKGYWRALIQLVGWIPGGGEVRTVPDFQNDPACDPPVGACPL